MYYYYRLLSCHLGCVHDSLCYATFWYYEGASPLQRMQEREAASHMLLLVLSLSSLAFAIL